MWKMGGQFWFPEGRDDSSPSGAWQERLGKESLCREASTGPSTLGEGLGGPQSPTLGSTHCPGPLLPGPSGSLGAHPDL